MNVWFALTFFSNLPPMRYALGSSLALVPYLYQEVDRWLKFFYLTIFFMKLTLLGLTFVCLSLKSKSLSFYIGLETTLAVVCKTHNGVKALETFGMQGLMNKRSCFYGAEASIGRPLDHWYIIICRENLRFEVMMMSCCK